mgnify:FL=1
MRGTERQVEVDDDGIGKGGEMLVEGTTIAMEAPSGQDPLACEITRSHRDCTPPAHYKVAAWLDVQTLDIHCHPEEEGIHWHPAEGTREEGHQNWDRKVPGSGTPQPQDWSGTANWLEPPHHEIQWTTCLSS